MRVGDGPFKLGSFEATQPGFAAPHLTAGEAGLGGILPVESQARPGNPPILPCFRRGGSQARAAWKRSRNSAKPPNSIAARMSAISFS